MPSVSSARVASTSASAAASVPASTTVQPGRDPPGPSRRRGTPLRPPWTATVGALIPAPTHVLQHPRFVHRGQVLVEVVGSLAVSMNQPVGHMVRISTKENPAPATCALRARSAAAWSGPRCRRC